MSIEIRNVSKQFGDFQALRDVSLDIASGELIALLGPSGCGKTTLLRIIAGLETADVGTIHFSGEDTTDVHVRERNVGFVFQHYALFRHMTVFENVAFGLRVKPRSERPSEAQIKKKVMDLLKLVQLDWLAERYPSQLSGGQRQRIALARALAIRPDVMLLDIEMPGLDGLAAAAVLQAEMPECHVLILTTFGRPGYLRGAVDAGVTGFVVKDTPAAELADAVRRVHAGLRVIDPTLATESLTSGDNPLTARECEVLRAALSGAPVAQIAAQVHLSAGTVRNHLSAAIGKTNTATRAEAARVARERGWVRDDK